MIIVTALLLPLQCAVCCSGRAQQAWRRAADAGAACNVTTTRRESADNSASTFKAAHRCAPFLREARAQGVVKVGRWKAEKTER